MSHPDPWHPEGHWLYGALGEHESDGHLHISHVALHLGQKGQTLQAGDKQEVTSLRRQHSFIEEKMRVRVCFYLMRLVRAKTAALQEVRRFGGDLINEHSGVALKNATNAAHTSSFTTLFW